MALQLRILGKVQGVWYRGWTVAQAQRLGLSGWVRNRSDGSVEAWIEGDETALDTMMALCRQGPPAARVDEIRSERVKDARRQGFEQLPND